MVSLVEDEKVDLVHVDKGMVETLIKHIRGADYDPIIPESLIPQVLTPDVIDQLSAEPRDWLIKVAFEHGILLKNKSNFVDQKKGNPPWVSGGLIFEFLFDNPSQE